jgi:hypothetical protein
MFALIWKDEISFGDLLTVAGFLLTLAGLLFAGWQFRRNGLVERARFLIEMADRHLEDKDVLKLFYKILHREFRFNAQSKDEQSLDTLLSHFNLIGRMLQMGILSKKDASFFIPEARCVLQNPEVRKYIAQANKDPESPPGGCGRTRAIGHNEFLRMRDAHFNCASGLAVHHLTYYNYRGCVG